jgi:hypothetical protein
MIEVTDWAKDILHRSNQAARRFNPGASVRLARRGGEVQAMFIDRPGPNDQAIQLGEQLTIFVEHGLEGLIDVEEPHDRLVLRPSGSRPNERGHDGRAAGGDQRSIW